MPKPKIDRVKLNQLLKAGKSQREVAQVFGVSEGAISKAKKELNLAVVKSVTLESAHKVVDKNLDAVAQLQKINKAANQLLDELMGKEKVVQELATVINKINEGNPADVKGITKLVKQIISDKNTALKACQEIRGQLSLQLDIFKTLYDMEAIREFQEEVLTVIGGVSQDVRRKIIEKLKEKRAIRSVTRFT
jgi:Trp operon repressor